jgi:hypothetical protein
VPLLTAEIARGAGFAGAAGRRRRFHLLLDAYGYAGDRTAIRDAIIGRAERNVAMIRQFADGGEPVFQRMLPRAANRDQLRTRHRPASRRAHGTGPDRAVRDRAEGSQAAAGR